MTNAAFHIARLFTWCFLLFFAVLPSQAQLVINEIQSSNSMTIQDEDANSSDWIEIYNAGDATIDLTGYALSDDPALPNKWTFQNGSIGAGDFLVVFASGKDVSDIDLNVAPYEGLKPFIYGFADSQNSTPGTSTVTPLDFNDGIYQTVNGNVEISASLDLQPPGDLGFSYAGITMRWVDWDGTPIDLSAYNRFQILANIDAGKQVRVELEQLGVDPWVGYGLMLTGTGADKWYDIPITGDGVAPLDLSVMEGLVFGRWTPYGNVDLRVKDLRFYTEDLAYHTNFKLSKSGEQVVLTDPTGQQVDQMTFGSLPEDMSAGLDVDGIGEYGIFTSPTPGATNNNSTSYQDFCNDVLTFDLTAGFYQGSQQVAISGSSNIIYSVTGKAPSNDFGIPYTGPITIDSTTVIKAVCASSTQLPGKVVTNTYLIDEDINIPVFSLSTDSLHLYSHQHGLFAFGPDADSTTVPYFGSNFWKGWEKPIHVEYFGKDKQRHIDQLAGALVFGNWSRANDQKSIRLKADKDYGDNDFDYQFFERKPIDSFKHLVLRNSGGDFNQTMIHDATNQISAAGFADMEYQEYQPSIVFINGVFHGIMNIREKVNEHFIEGNTGVDKDKLDIIEAWGTDNYGENNWHEFMDWALAIDVTTDAGYQRVIDSVDVSSLVDHVAIQSFYLNWDWPQNNTKMWRSHKDRKWRWILFDTDLTHGLWNLLPADSNALRRLAIPDQSETAMLFTHLMKNEQFSDYFANRNADMVNTIFQTDTLLALWQRHADVIEPYIVRHIKRWPNEWNQIDPMGHWNNTFVTLIDFMEQRPTTWRADIREHYELPAQWSVNLSVDPPGAGYIKISTIVPESYPWNGIYFEDIPVEIKAIAAPGYSFNQWVAPGQDFSTSTTSQATLNLESAVSVIAMFDGVGTLPSLDLSEIHYHPKDGVGEAWFEVVNNGMTALDLSGWTFQDENFYNNYEFPFGTIIEPGERLVVAEDMDAFTAAYPWVKTPVIGPTGFGLDNDSDEINLYNLLGELQSAVRYRDSLDWPIEADGSGPSLEFDSTGTDINDGKQWFAGCDGGTPGYAWNSNCSNSVEENELAVVAWFPNPTKSHLTVDWTENLQGKLSITSLLGQQVKSFSLNPGLNQLELDLPTGQYLLTWITDQGHLRSDKLVVR